MAQPVLTSLVLRAARAAEWRRSAPAVCARPAHCAGRLPPDGEGHHVHAPVSIVNRRPTSGSPNWSDQQSLRPPAWCQQCRPAARIRPTSHKAIFLKNPPIPDTGRRKQGECPRRTSNTEVDRLGGPRRLRRGGLPSATQARFTPCRVAKTIAAVERTTSAAALRRATADQTVSPVGQQFDVG